MLVNENKMKIFVLVENCIYTPILGTEVKINQHFSILKIFKIYLRKKLKMVFCLKLLFNRKY